MNKGKLIKVDKRWEDVRGRRGRRGDQRREKRTTSYIEVTVCSFRGAQEECGKSEDKRGKEEREHQ